MAEETESKEVSSVAGVDVEALRERYGSNSLKDKKREKLEPVVKTPVKRAEKTFGKRVGESIIVEGVRDVGAYLFFDVLIPKTKEIILDLVSEGLSRTLFGESASTNRKRSGYTSYSSITRSSSRRREDYGGPGSTRDLSRRQRSQHDFSDIIIATRVEAEEVLDRMADNIDRYGVCTVADFYDLVGVTQEYTDDRWGWTQMRRSRIVRVRDGYILDLDRPVLLQR